MGEIKKKRRIHMPAFKDKKRNSWYTAFYYTDWTGKRRKN